MADDADDALWDPYWECPNCGARVHISVTLGEVDGLWEKPQPVEIESVELQQGLFEVRVGGFHPVLELHQCANGGDGGLDAVPARPLDGLPTRAASAERDVDDD
jgi:hypothetical protein